MRAARRWHGWRNAFIRTRRRSRTTAVQERRTCQRTRQVYRAERPTHPGSPVPGLTTIEGHGLSGQPVVTPATNADPAPEMDGSSSSFGCPEWLFDHSVFASMSNSSRSLRRSPEPQLGLFEILVTGPMGLDVRGSSSSPRTGNAIPSAIRVPDDGRLKYLHCDGGIASPASLARGPHRLR